MKAPLSNPKVLALFSQNLAFDHPSAFPLPIGLDFHTIASRKEGAWGRPQMEPQQQEDELWSIMDDAKPWNLRTRGPLVGFSIDTNEAARRTCVTKLIMVEDVSLAPEGMPRNETWQMMAEHQFIASPPGVGMDCHRTWEALLLGCVPIVQRMPTLSPMFKDLPVWEVDGYEQVTAASMAEMQKEVAANLAGGRYNFKKLTVDWWRNKIARKARELAKLKPVWP
ncbi:MAG: hypothetical protein AAFO68_05740 [Pseudomonadota bacterium]